jgi:hypothetical protein
MVNQTNNDNVNNKKKTDNSNKGLLFCFTDFKNIENGYTDIYNEYKDVIRGIAWGKETCPTTGKVHNQGFIQMFTQSRYSAIQKIFKSKCHFEVCHGNIQQNETYCSKENNYIKLGYFCYKGYRTDFHNIKDDLENGASEYDIMNNYTGQYIRYSAGIQKMKALIDKKKSRKFRNVDTTVLCGLAGAGKSSYVYNTYGHENVFTIDSKMMNTDFWGSYSNEKILLIDDFSGWIQYNYLLRVLDGHPFELNIKNSYAFANWEKVYITSNTLPKNWYRNVKFNLQRRINKCIVVCKGNTNALHTPLEKSQYWDIVYENEYDNLNFDEVLSILNKNNYS